MSLGYCLGSAAPLYNLALVAVVVYLFIKMFSLENKKAFLLPWKLIFIALCIFVVETIITILKGMNLIFFPAFVNGFFEMGIISLFIYSLLIQREHTSNLNKKGK